MIEHGFTERAAQRPWSGGRPWRAPEPGSGAAGPDGGPVVEPRAELRWTGAELAMALADAEADLDGPELTTVGVRARAHLVDLAVAAERVGAWAASVQARAVAGLQAQFMAEQDLDEDDLRQHAEAAGVVAGPGRARGLGEELAAFGQSGRATSACLMLALGVSAWAADRLVALALGLAEQPDLAGALAEGRVDLSQARAIHDATAALPPAARDRVVASVVTDPDDLTGPGPVTDPGSGPGGSGSGVVLVRELRDGSRPVWSVPAHQLRPILAREVALVAPESVEDGERVVARGRRVDYAAGTAARSGSLVLHGPEADLAAAYDRLETDARAARRCGAPETLDQLRYDLAIAAITGGALGLTLTPPDPPTTHPPTGPGGPGRARRKIMIDVVVAADTLLGVDDQPAVLRTRAGDVPISATAARQLAHASDATWPPAPPPTSAPATHRPNGSPTSSESATGTPPGSPPAPPAPSSSTTSSSTTTTRRRAVARPAQPTSPPPANATTKTRPTGWSRSAATPTPS